jgi:hypothetical protein
MMGATTSVIASKSHRLAIVMFWGSHKTLRDRYLFIGVLALLVTVLLVFVTSCDSNKVSVFNDLPYPVALLACNGLDPVDFEAGEERRIDIFSPCLVRTSTAGDIGCLLFPPEAFEDVVIKVSSMDTTIDADDCALREDY